MFHCSMLGPEQVGLKMLAHRFFTEDIADVNRRHAHLSDTNNPVKQAALIGVTQFTDWGAEHTL